MATVAIDLDMLNELFVNQKNLDDIFNDDFFLDSSMSIEDHSSETSTSKDYLDIQFNKHMSSNSENTYYRYIIKLIVPVILEVTAISYGIMYFN